MIKKKKFIPLLNKNDNSLFLIDEYFKDYFLRKGFRKFSNNKMILNFFFKFLRVPLIFFKKIKTSKILFKNPPNKDYIIYDDTLTKYLELLLKDKDYIILPTRVERINEFYLSKDIIFYLLKNLFKRSLKQNYLVKLIKTISPKIVLTHIDNSQDFSITTKIFNNSRIKFFAIQNAGREGDAFHKLYFDNFFIFGKHYQDLYLKKNVRVKKFHIIGSLKTNLIMKSLSEKIKNCDKNKYDICLISEPQRSLNGDFAYIKDYADLKGTVAKYVVKFCKENRLELIFSGKFPLESDYNDFEEIFYKKYLENLDFKISQGKIDEFNSYLNIIQSKLIIGVNSTMLQESIVLEKKILQCNLLNHPDLDLNFPEECSLKEFGYDKFKEKTLNLLSLDYQKYLQKNSNKFNYMMHKNFNFNEILSI